jgi:quaternary ammonium compound-resistance protein SugE
MAWTYVLIASGFEILFALGLKYTAGFTRRGPSLLTVVAGVASFLILSQSLKTLPVGTGYAM